MGITEIVGLLSLGVVLVANVVLVSRFLTKLELKPSEIRVGEMISEKVSSHERVAMHNGAHFEKMIDERVELHPILKQYKVTAYRIDQLEPDVKQIKNDIQKIFFTLAKRQSDGRE